MRFMRTSEIRLALTLLAGITTLANCGCGLTSRLRHREMHEVCCQEVYGVDDRIFHGHGKTCWRTWNNEAWALQGCPSSLDGSGQYPHVIDMQQYGTAAPQAASEMPQQVPETPDDTVEIPQDAGEIPQDDVEIPAAPEDSDQAEELFQQ